MDDKTQQLIEKLAEKFGTSVEHLWAVLVRQARIGVISDVLVLAITVAIVIFAFRYAWRSWETWDDDLKPLIVALFTLAALGATLFICCSVDSIISGLFNPEYLALKHFIK